MAHSFYQSGCDHRTHQDAEKVARHDNAGYEGGKALHGGAQSEQCSLKSVAKHHEADADQQCPGSAEVINHGSFSQVIA